MATKPEGNPRERIAWLSLFGLAGVAGVIALVICGVSRRKWGSTKMCSARWTRFTRP